MDTPIPPRRTIDALLKALPTELSSGNDPQISLAAASVVRVYEYALSLQVDLSELKLLRSRLRETALTLLRRLEHLDTLNTRASRTLAELHQTPLAAICTVLSITREQLMTEVSSTPSRR